MSGPRRYILDGHTPVEEPDFNKWATWMERADRHVGLAHANGYCVSTIFLGVDHGVEPDVALFETMIFPEDSYADVYCERYSTWEAAAAGHKDAVGRVKMGWV